MHLDCGNQNVAASCRMGRTALLGVLFLGCSQLLNASGENVIASACACVDVPCRSVRVWGELAQARLSRTALPLRLAWALTVHRSQVGSRRGRS